MRNCFGELQLDGHDLDGKPCLGIKRYPTYTCGHCSSIVIIRDDRTRPRNHCLSCDSWICEKNEICNTHCTPLHAMSYDHFEGAGEHGKFVPAIMQGVTTVDEAHKRGLITT
jgi:hypothetical protein